MTRDQIIEFLEAGGYICRDEYTTTPTVYDHNGHAVGKCPIVTMERIANADGMTAWVDLWDGHYVGPRLIGKYTEFENKTHCKSIADDLSDYVNGYVYKCPECGEIITIDDDREKHLCKCGYIGDIDEYEQQSIYDYFDDMLDIEYRIDRDRDLKSVQICVAWGGPNIYIDTASGDVELYWWSDRARWPMDRDVITAVDEFAEELYRGY